MKTPVLMVHGMCCTGAVWTEFQSWFEARGARVYAPTLRPELRVNVRQRAPEGLRYLSLADYVADLELEIERIQAETGETPAVIGHSMGGLLGGALAARGRVRAGVFISPAAPAGIRDFQTQVFWRGHALAGRFGWTPSVIKPDRRTLDSLVLNAIPAARRASIAENMVCESGRVFADCSGFPIDERGIRVPILTIAAGRDRLVPASLVRLTARKFAPIGGEFREYPGHAHWLYSEPGWQTVASDVLGWLERVAERRERDPRTPATPLQL